ncbi:MULTISPECIES: TerD family protein [Okeania]|uniref:TerD family protein n=1 Tax=Okeania hirsuta TaxID=1458930 RepID=A0A3N6PF27_9CYAN|nr:MULTISPECIES: TerD family protein [Okeania]NEP39322.1 TerD family protein [Okeania sp. SIO2H7]NEP71823.1 TerD family protein [Okeania sp. SIO2G5]NEP92843.1 TerD family protein [Okeania sp. SIO2F5]NEQ90920.1 TerD family protein [Okeania sp. SIO2G4]NES75692.1 TerD family protein [Okeania sp. SIO1H4]
MTIKLEKGQKIVLNKSEYDLSRLTMGLGWDVAKSASGLAGLFGNRSDFDLDGYAILLQENDQLKNYKEDVIYYGHLESQDKTVIHSGDNLTGEGDGDDEQIILKLNSIPEKYQKIILAVSIYQAKERKQQFGMVENAFVRAVDHKGIEIAKYTLSGNGTYQGKISMLMGAIYRDNTVWKFTALGDPLDSDMNGVVGSFLK